MQSPADRGLSRSLRTYHPGVASPAPVPRSRGSTAVQAWRSEASACPSPPAPFGEEKYMDATTLGRAWAAHPVEAELTMAMARTGRRRGIDFFFLGLDASRVGTGQPFVAEAPTIPLPLLCAASALFFSAELRRVKVNNTLGHASDVDWVKTQTYWSKDTLFVPSGLQ